jgi:hypothetical protein
MSSDEHEAQSPIQEEDELSESPQEWWQAVKEDPSRTRPRNMFSVVDLTYEQYVEKHYEVMLRIHREQMQMQMQQMGGMQMQQQHLHQQRA